MVKERERRTRRPGKNKEGRVGSAAAEESAWRALLCCSGSSSLLSFAFCLQGLAFPDHRRITLMFSVLAWDDSAVRRSTSRHDTATQQPKRGALTGSAVTLPIEGGEDKRPLFDTLVCSAAWSRRDLRTHGSPRTRRGVIIVGTLAATSTRPVRSWFWDPFGLGLRLGPDRTRDKS